jgi:outer membrane protein assembly factor BamB
MAGPARRTWRAGNSRAFAPRPLDFPARVMGRSNSAREIARLGDWNYTNNMIGERAIIHNGKLYAPLYDPDHGVNGGLAILNPITGAVIRHFTIPGYCTAAAPAFDKNGYLHIYDCGGFIKKLDEDTGTVLRTLSIGALSIGKQSPTIL